MWLKLLSRNSIEDLIKPQLVNGKWRQPAIGGRQKAQLRTYFEKAGVPWIYEKETPEVHFKSPYNRKPKGDAIERNYEVRLASIRRALSTQDERLEKLRQDKLNAKPAVGQDRIVLGALKGLGQLENEGKKSGKQLLLAAKAAQQAEAKALGIKAPGKKQGTKMGLTSKGGQIGKKEREVMNMTKTMGSDIFTGSSTGAAKEANEDKKGAK